MAKKKGGKDDPKEAARRRRQAENTRRWRRRLKRGISIYRVELEDETLNLLCRFGGLAEKEAGDREAVARSLGVVLRRGLLLLVREAARGR